MKGIYLFLFCMLGLISLTQAQSDKLNDATKLDLFIMGPLIENGRPLIILGNDKGKISKIAVPGEKKDYKEALDEYCKNFGYKNCRVENEYETDENPRDVILENIDDTNHYIIRKGEEKAFRVFEVASDSKGDEM